MDDSINKPVGGDIHDKSNNVTVNVVEHILDNESVEANKKKKKV